MVCVNAICVVTEEENEVSEVVEQKSVLASELCDGFDGISLKESYWESMRECSVKNQDCVRLKSVLLTS